jgi:hypothetical protein
MSHQSLNPVQFKEHPHPHYSYDPPWPDLHYHLHYAHGIDTNRAMNMDDDEAERTHRGIHS